MVDIHWMNERKSMGSFLARSRSAYTTSPSVHSNTLRFLTYICSIGRCCLQYTRGVKNGGRVLVFMCSGPWTMYTFTTSHEADAELCRNGMPFHWRIGNAVDDWTEEGNGVWKEIDIENEDGTKCAPNDDPNWWSTWWHLHEMARASESISDPKWRWGGSNKCGS